MILLIYKRCEGYRNRDIKNMNSKRRNASKKITGCKKPTATAAVDTVPL